MISIDEFKKAEIRIGLIREAIKVEGADKLLRLSVDLGEAAPRQVISGIAPYYPDPQALVGVKCAFVANLEPRVIRGLESQGMILAATTPEGGFALLTPSGDLPPGAGIR